MHKRDRGGDGEISAQPSCRLYADPSLIEPRARASVLHTRTDGATGIMSNCSLEASRMLLTMLRRADVLE